MTEHKFNKEYDIILCALLLLLDRFEKEDQLFVTQSIWWLASIIQVTEILTHYRHYKIFPSDYVANIVVTPSPMQDTAQSLVLQSEILVLDLSDNKFSVGEECI